MNGPLCFAPTVLQADSCLYPSRPRKSHTCSFPGIPRTFLTQFSLTLECCFQLFQLVNSYSTSKAHFKCPYPLSPSPFALFLRTAMFAHLAPRGQESPHSLPRVSHPTTQGTTQQQHVSDGKEEPLAAHLSQLRLCPTPSLQRDWGGKGGVGPSATVRADSTPGSGLSVSSHLGCELRTAYRPERRGASPGGGNLRTLGRGGTEWRGEDPGRSVSRRTRGPELTAGKGGALRRGGCIWVGEGETAQETAATVLL